MAQTQTADKTQGNKASLKAPTAGTQPPAQTGGAAPQQADQPNKDVATAEPAISARFTQMVVKEFSAITNSSVTFTEPQKRLAQHMFVKLDATLQELEKKRQDKNEKDKAPIVWQNINMQKLAMDAVHRIELGLDALIPNHIWPIPYFNSRTKKYDVDLRIGYVGKDYYRRKMAINPPKDVRYELVRTNDKLVVFMKGKLNPVETYDLQVPDPFNRGDVKGGFAYLEYEDASKNKLILLSLKDFEKAKAAAKSMDFWGKYPEQMQYKTLVIRATDKLQIDPAKVNASFLAVENDDISDALEVQAQIEDKANKGAVIDLTAEECHETTGSAGPTPESEQPASTLQADPPCVCDDMTAQKLTEWDCPKHGTYKGGRFTKSEADFKLAPAGGPGY